MPLDVISFILYAIIVAMVSGFISSLLGIGGGFIRVPLIAYLFGVSIKVAYSVNYLIIALGSLAGVYVYWKHKNIDIKVFFLGCLASITGMILSSYFVGKYVSSELLKSIFGISYIILGIYMIFHSVRTTEKKNVKIIKHRRILLILLMFLTGFASGFMGAGGGVYYVPILISLGYPTNMAIGTSLLLVVFTSLAGGLTLSYIGFVDARLFIAIAIPTLLATWSGGKISVKMHPKTLEAIYASLMILVGAFMLFA